MAGPVAQFPAALYALNVKEGRARWNCWLLEMFVDALPCDRSGHTRRRRSIRERSRLWGCSRREAAAVVARYTEWSGPKAGQNPPGIIEETSFFGPNADRNSYINQLPVGAGVSPPLKRGAYPQSVAAPTVRANPRAHPPRRPPRIPENLPEIGRRGDGLVHIADLPDADRAEMAADRDRVLALLRRAN